MISSISRVHNNYVDYIFLEPLVEGKPYNFGALSLSSSFFETTLGFLETALVKSALGKRTKSKISPDKLYPNLRFELWDNVIGV